MGQTGVSAVGGASSIWWNPALAGVVGGLTLQSFRSPGDGRGLFGGLSARTRFGGVGIYLFDLSIAGFEAREIPGTPSGEFTLRESILAIAGAVDLPFDLRAGIAIKGTMEDIYGEVATDYPLLDVGVLWSSGAVSAGAAAANVELSDRNRDATPRSLRAGATYRRSEGGLDWRASAELSGVRGIPPAYHVGIEAGWRDRFFLRTGATLTRDDLQPSFGLGLEVGGYNFDAATSLSDEELGDSWRFEIGYKF